MNNGDDFNIPEGGWLGGPPLLSDLRSSPRVDPQEFVGMLEVVETSTIATEDMKCLHCWSDFGTMDVEMVDLRAGEVKADNAPVKMRCGPGHLIDKTCLMELIDAGIHLCPICKVDIAVLVDQGDHGSVPEPSYVREDIWGLQIHQSRTCHLLTPCCCK